MLVKSAGSVYVFLLYILYGTDKEPPKSAWFVALNSSEISNSVGSKQTSNKDVKQIKILATFCLQIRYNQAINSKKAVLLN